VEGADFGAASFGSLGRFPTVSLGGGFGIG
jgi:hypothetical protein